jgi:CHAT domain-containing protein
MLKSHHSANKFGGILSVGQATTAGQPALPGTIEELKQIKKQAGSMAFTQLDGKEATIEGVMNAMENHSWVHLACHASQSLNDPMASGFHLHNGTLDLGTIAKRQLKQADFAFLSACQTATGDEKYPEEAAHLAAGMMVAGYPTVIATMWSINDSDAPLIAELVYAHILDGGVADSRLAAKALHEAVKCLREKVGDRSFALWVPYIHIGL